MSRKIRPDHGINEPKTTKPFDSYRIFRWRTVPVFEETPRVNPIANEEQAAGVHDNKCGTKGT